MVEEARSVFVLQVVVLSLDGEAPWSSGVDLPPTASPQLRGPVRLASPFAGLRGAADLAHEPSADAVVDRRDDDGGFRRRSFGIDDRRLPACLGGLLFQGLRSLSSGAPPTALVVSGVVDLQRGWDGIGESQFNEVLNTELADIIKACKCLDDKWFPKFTVIVAQKRHHTRFFLPNERNHNEVTNVQPGTVVDKGICHPRNYDFYMCAHAGMIGTTRPTHYHVLHDETGFSPDELQELVHSLSYVYQRSTTAISVVAPIYYAHLAAAQVGKFTRLDDMSETSSSHATQAADTPVQELARLHAKVASSMFFC